MPPTAVQPVSPLAEATSEVSRQPTADQDDPRDHGSEEEGHVQSPEAFFAEVTRRPDVDEILKRLAAL